MTKYILVRHVETLGNSEKRLIGHTESPYTKYGIFMKKRLIEELLSINELDPFDIIYTSPMKRALYIAKKLSVDTNCSYINSDMLKEFNFGIFEGLTADEAEKKNPQLWYDWLNDYNNVTLTNGENYLNYHKKIKKFLELNAKKNKDKTVVIIAHGGTVHSLLVNLLNLPLDSRWHFDIALGSICIINSIEGYGVMKKLYTPNYDEKEIAFGRS